MSSETKDIAEGATKGILEWGEEKIKQLVRKFIDKEVAFIQDQKIIDLVKSQLKRGEFALYNKFIKNDELKLLTKMGLTLRQLDAENDHASLQTLRDKLFYKFGKNGLYIAQFVSNKLLSEFITGVAEKTGSEGELVKRIEEFLLNIEKHVIFIQYKHNVKIKINQIYSKINANSPDQLLIFSAKSAIKICKKIRANLEKNLEKISDYSIKVIEEEHKMIILLLKEESYFILPEQ